ncbi:tannase/feruloyl esterase family alpha/beta hydrolase [Phytohalomonas tamaricis]|uniref:tannase/feruloyl esterase family alpha/beta hydrolase n=1 Tax=Phytohalomonas tamaricis TaxID=2081032 RepID=UPI000D0B18DF|nr:tannase/feruloyl esterase family alpha/beta hydrolase [Phytohalomonas tamaricis]
MKTWISTLGGVAVLALTLVGQEAHARQESHAWQESHVRQESHGQATPETLNVVNPTASCASLADVDLTQIGGEGSAVTSATETTSDGISVCSVEGTLAPEINFQVLLPTESWTQRYLQVGCGGLCGQITLTSGASDGCKVLNDGGFVMAATDMGHSGEMMSDGSWGLDDQKRADFAYRAQHLTSEAAKTLIKTFYGQPQQYAYFNGCSDGGREALMEAMRFPDDFDGIIAGAPAMLFQVQNTLYHAWQAESNTDENGNVILLTDRLPILHNAVVEACDAKDGAKDGLIANPAACHFDVARITCTQDATDTSACLTPAEAEVARKFYAGPRDPETGAYLTAGQPLYGSELEWDGVYVTDAADGSLMSTNASLAVIRYLAFEEARPDATLDSFSFTTSTLDALRPRHKLFDATNPDLSAFKQSGGKLIMWHGLSDPHISPANTVALHKAMYAQMGKKNVQQFERLYLLPGVGHCGQGEGPSNIDLLTPMMSWVERGNAPYAVMTSATSAESDSDTASSGSDVAGDASQKGGKHKGEKHRKPPMTQQSTLAEASRPVYPYPATAHYTGRGSVYDAANWEKGHPAETVHLRDWPGSDLFTPYNFSEQ